LYYLAIGCARDRLRDQREKRNKEKKRKEKRGKKKKRKKEGEKKGAIFVVDDTRFVTGSFIFAEVRNRAEIVRGTILIQSRGYEGQVQRWKCGTFIIFLDITDIN